MFGLEIKPTAKESKRKNDFEATNIEYALKIQDELKENVATSKTVLDSQSH